MVVQRDRNNGKGNRGLVIFFTTVIGLAIVVATYYLWANGSIAKDMVAGIFIAVVLISIIIVSITGRR